MPKPPPQTIGTNPLDLLVPGAPAAALAGAAAGARRTLARPASTVLTVTVPADLADRLEQLFVVMPGLDLDTLASEALELVLARLRRTGGAGAGARVPGPGKAKGKAKAKANSKAQAAGARKSVRGKGRDSDSAGRTVAVILGE